MDLDRGARHCPGALSGRSDTAIRTTGVVKRFGPVLALAGVDVEVSRGEIVALLGRNGAGKSTLIRILATSVEPDDGQVLVAGIDVIRHPQSARRRIGLVLGEDRSFFWRLSGQQNLEFFAAMRGLSRREARATAVRALGAVGLFDVSDRRVDRYSTGMRSRLGIARALLGSPNVLLLDEPTRSLDPASAIEVRALLRSLADELQVSVLFATHDLHEAAATASRVIILEAGRVIANRQGAFDAAGLEADVVGAYR
jgi:ABC-2 type transport system ATP-binding protein